MGSRGVPRGCVRGFQEHLKGVPAAFTVSGGFEGASKYCISISGTIEDCFRCVSGVSGVFPGLPDGFRKFQGRFNGTMEVSVAFRGVSGAFKRGFNVFFVVSEISLNFEGIKSIKGYMGFRERFNSMKCNIVPLELPEIP